MRACCIFAVTLACCTLSWGQLTPEEAYHKLQQKQKEKTAAASQPADGAAKASGAALGRMIHEGWEAIAARRYADAAVTFDKVIVADARDTVALLGRGICKYELKEYKLADADLQRAYNLSSAGGSSRASLQLVIAAAAAAVANGNSMRGAKMLRDFMESTDKNGQLDEELQNDLGIALSHADAQARKLPLFEEALRFYLEYDKKLDQQKKDATSRWGTKWIETKSADEKWKEYQEASHRVEQATSNYQHSTVARERAYDNYLEVVGGLRLHTSDETYKYTNEFKQSVIVENAAKKQMNQAIEKLTKTDKPPFPQRIEHDWREPR